MHPGRPFTQLMIECSSGGASSLPLLGYVLTWLCPAAAFINTTPDEPEPSMRTFVDGGLIANNPTMQVT